MESLVENLDEKVEKLGGNPLKGLSREKTALPPKNTPFFRLSSHFRTRTASLYCHLFSHLLFLSYRFRVSILLIRTSHPSGSRLVMAQIFHFPAWQAGVMVFILDRNEVNGRLPLFYGLTELN